MAFLSFPTTAQMEAFRFQPRHVGREVYDAEAGDLYVVTAPGLGSAVLNVLDGSGGGGVTDHGALTGLGDDDHTQYTLASGTRAFTGAQSMGGNKLTNLATATSAADAVRYDQLTSSTVWDARVVPSSGLHASSNEFTTGLGALTGDWDEGAVMTASVDTTRRELLLEHTQVAGNPRAAAVYTTFPSDTFTFLGWCSSNRWTIAGTSPFPMLVLGQDLSVALSDWVGCYFGYVRTGTQGVSVGQFTASAYNVVPTVVNGRNLGGETGLWMRARVTRIPAVNTTVEYDVCSDLADGNTWMTVGSVTAGYAAAHWGLGIYSSLAGTHYATWKMCRVFDGVAGFGDTRNGGYLVT